MKTAIKVFWILRFIYCGGTVLFRILFRNWLVASDYYHLSALGFGEVAYKGIIIFFGLLPLCYVIPMGRRTFICLKQDEEMGTALKVCTLLFVDLVAGILMLCYNDAPRAHYAYHQAQPLNSDKKVTIVVKLNSGKSVFMTDTIRVLSAKLQLMVENRTITQAECNKHLTNFCKQ